VNRCGITRWGIPASLGKENFMVKTEDEIVRKSDDAKGEDTAKTRVDKEADELAKKASKTEQKFDRENNIFTK
jgi:hypothetical protein